MLNVNDLRNGAVFKESGNLFQVLTYEHIKMGRGSGTIKVKVKNLKTNSITEKSFITGAKVEEADVEKRKAQFLYKQSLPAEAGRDGENFYFMDNENFEQFPLSQGTLGDDFKYLKEGLEVALITGEGQALALELPNSIVYTISETGPEEKGNSVSNVYKEAVMDNGLIVKVPMFMKIGEKVKVDTRTGSYVERVK
ncbi:elongation factor P [Candidatus Daviesbacteria bacterium]|nr:elongation factor P [Candidatus Daviesbacteria bacterium]